MNNIKSPVHPTLSIYPVVCKREGMRKAGNVKKWYATNYMTRRNIDNSFKINFILTLLITGDTLEYVAEGATNRPHRTVKIAIKY